MMARFFSQEEQEEQNDHDEQSPWNLCVQCEYLY